MKRDRVKCDIQVTTKWELNPILEEKVGREWDVGSSNISLPLLIYSHTE